MDKLPEDFKKKWVAALRSGEYKQGRGRLYREDSDTYCCLGVACKVVGAHVGLSWFIGHNIEGVPEILKGHNGIPSTLSSMNDGKNQVRPKSFLEIADYIEANL